MSDLAEAMEIIRRNQIDGGGIDTNDLTKSAITGALRSLDPHSNYFDAPDFRELLEEQQSEYSGIGATIANYSIGGELATYVVATFPGSPAAKAKLGFGDKILTVDRVNAIGLGSDEVRDKVRGGRGTIVRLTVQKAATGSVESVDLRRNIVPQPSIPDYYMLRPGVGYIDLSTGFSYTTADEIGRSLKDLHAQGMTSLILDLRDNPGGILEQAVKVAEKFLPEGAVIVSQRGRFRIDNRIWKSANKNVETMPIVVLVNENSASASEVLAGALQDHDRALIVGEKTFGKGLVQSVFNLPYASGLTLTTARYYTPSGRSIQRDYSDGSLYDYFGHKKPNGDNTSRPESRTTTNRTVFGGDGINPDELVKAANLSPIQNALIDPLFFFTRDVIAGKVKGLENQKMSAVVKPGSRISPADSTLSDRLLEEFFSYAGKEKAWSIPRSTLSSERDFIKMRLRYNLVMAGYGSIPAIQVLVEDDPQVAKAVEALPRAQQLALAASKVRP